MKRYLVKINNNNEEVFKQSTKSKRRLLNKLRDFKWNEGLAGYLRVTYGLGTDCWGNENKFINEGEYNNKKDILGALGQFDEVSLKELVGNTN